MEIPLCTLDLAKYTLPDEVRGLEALLPFL